MKVSTRGRYGLRALVDMTIHSNNAPVSLVQVANRQKISLNYLEQVFGTLRKAGIVVSVKGAGGGYKLARDAESITFNHRPDSGRRAGCSSGGDREACMEQD